MSPGLWARLRAYAAAPRTPDFLRRLKAFCMAEARHWWMSINNVLTPGEIRIFVTELLHSEYHRDRTAVLGNDVQGAAIKLR
eukprot:5089732-Pleurochrysis_carterae.AAC.1